MEYQNFSKFLKLVDLWVPEILKYPTEPNPWKPVYSIKQEVRNMSERKLQALDHLLNDPGVRYCEERQDSYLNRWKGREQEVRK